MLVHRGAQLGAPLGGQHDLRCWCTDQSGRQQPLVPDAPPAPWAALPHGTSEGLSGLFAPDCLGFVFIDGNHTGYWGQRDAEFANKLVCPGGVVVVHDLWDDRRYADLSDAVEQVPQEHGWRLADREDCTSVFVLPTSR